MRVPLSFSLRPLALYMLLIALSATASGCFAVYRVGMEVLFEKVELPESRIVDAVAYREDPDADPDQHRLDLYLPVGDGWPVVVFVFGGGWDSGDKNLTFAGADIYANIGRYFARRGIGAAVINYRLLPNAEWTDQIEDVARATAWVQDHIGAYGGNPDRLFLMGHSAGAHLSSRLAFDPDALGAFGRSPESICGVIAVSGAAYDLTDRETYSFGDGEEYFEQRFGHVEDWRRRVSTLPFVTAAAPPFLILYADGDPKGLQRQSQLLDAALREAGVPSRIVVVPNANHPRITLTLSRDDKTAGPATVDFIRTTACDGRE